MKKQNKPKSVITTRGETESNQIVHESNRITVLTPTRNAPPNQHIHGPGPMAQFLELKRLAVKQTPCLTCVIQFDPSNMIMRCNYKPVGDGESCGCGPYMKPGTIRKE